MHVNPGLKNPGLQSVTSLRDAETINVNGKTILRDAGTINGKTVAGGMVLGVRRYRQGLRALNKIYEKIFTSRLFGGFFNKFLQI